MRWYYVQHWDGVRWLMFTAHPPVSAVRITDAAVLEYLLG